LEVKKSKVNLQGAGAYCGGLPHSLFISKMLHQVLQCNNQVSRTCKTLGDDLQQPQYIETINVRKYAPIVQREVTCFCDVSYVSIPYGRGARKFLEPHTIVGGPPVFFVTADTHDHIPFDANE